MRHSAACRDAVHGVRHGAGRARAAADICGSGSGDGAVDALRPAGAEFKHNPALSRAADAVCLGGDKALVVDLEQHIGLNELRLYSGSPDCQDRLAGEDGGALGDRPDIARESEITEIFKKALGEHFPPAEVFDIFLVEVEVLNIIHDLLKPRRDCEAAVVGVPTVKNVEVCYLVGHAVVKVAVAHRELVVVAQHGEIKLSFVHSSLQRVVVWALYGMTPSNWII